MSKAPLAQREHSVNPYRGRLSVGGGTRGRVWTQRPVWGRLGA